MLPNGVTRVTLRTAALLTLCGPTFVGCSAGRAGATSDSIVEPATNGCHLATAVPSIQRWFTAWELTSREILHLPDASPPNVVFYDSACVYTTLRVTAGGAPPSAGPSLLGTRLVWRTARHGDTLVLPNGKKVPVQLLSFTDSDRATGPFFVMGLPTYWASAGYGQEPGLTGVFLHEFSHARQLPGMAAIIGPIDSAWSFPEELSDDAVQTHFGSDSTYVAAYMAERDLLYRAAAADSREEVHALAGQALTMIRSRHARWFTGENAVFATLDATFLSMEGAGQWAAYAWLAHPAGGGLDREAAIRRMLGRRRQWSQDEGLALFLVVDRLFPEWPSLVFRRPSIGAVELLERATRAVTR